MTIEYDDGVVAVPEDLSESQPIIDDKYDSWYQSHFIYNAYVNAAEAVRQEAQRAFIRGLDDIAFLLRDRANALEAQGERESREHQENHSPK